MVCGLTICLLECIKLYWTKVGDGVEGMCINLQWRKHVARSTQLDVKPINFNQPSHRRRLPKKVKKFLLKGSNKSNETEIENDESKAAMDKPKADVNSEVAISKANIKSGEAIPKAAPESSQKINACDEKPTEPSDNEPSGASDNMERKILGLKKAKIRRLEKRLEKKGFAKDCKKLTEPKNKEKSLTELLPTLQTLTDELNSTISQADEEESKHKLELRLIKAEQNDPQFQQYFQESFDVYKKYQMKIHKDPEEDCDERTFKRFLCNSPLKYQFSGGSKNVLLGSFHQHYILDGEIIAVAVLDILPDCVSSVYFYYDPDFSHLSLGTYSAIREVQLCGVLDRKYYYMGYYIHSCHKMRYKGKYYPSELLSPTSWKWHPIEKCIKFLDQQKYHTFETEPELMVKKKTLDISRVRLFLAGDILLFSEGFMSTLSNKNQANLRAYFHICDNIAERMIVVVNDADDESDDEES